MSQEWYYARDNEPMGPVSAVELRRLAVAGQLRPDDLGLEGGPDRMVPGEQRPRAVRGRVQAGRLFVDWPDGRQRGRSRGRRRRSQCHARRRRDGAAAACGRPNQCHAACRRPGHCRTGRECHWLSQCHTGNARRHFLDGPLDRLRRRFDVPLIERTAKLFWACGFFGLFAGMIAIAALEAILAAQDTPEYRLSHVIGAVQTILALAVLQYLAKKTSDAMARLFSPRAGRAGVEHAAGLFCTAKFVGRDNGPPGARHGVIANIPLRRAHAGHRRADCLRLPGCRRLAPRGDRCVDDTGSWLRRRSDRRPLFLAEGLFAGRAGGVWRGRDSRRSDDCLRFWTRLQLPGSEKLAGEGARGQKNRSRASSNQRALPGGSCSAPPPCRWRPTWPSC